MYICIVRSFINKVASNEMEARITKVGTSVGVIIPRYIAAEGEFFKGSPVNIEYKDNKIIITKLNKPRAGWTEAFANYAKEGEDSMLLPDHIDNEALDLI